MRRPVSAAEIPLTCWRVAAGGNRQGAGLRGKGEYGFLAELAGVAPLRVFGQDGPVVGPYALTPAVLDTVFGAVKDDGSGDGAIERAGYLFKVYLPGPEAAGVAAP